MAKKDNDAYREAQSNLDNYEGGEDEEFHRLNDKVIEAEEKASYLIKHRWVR